jgi:biotin carboxyl carrier protein
MLKVKVNNKHEHSIEFENATAGTIDGAAFLWDVIKVKDGSFHIIKDNKSYSVEVVKADIKEKSFTISVNGNKYQLAVKDKFDELLHSLGLDAMASKKVNEIKAPMPGLVLDVKVNEGDAVKKGDAVLVLEAMKMENILKASATATVKSIKVTEKTAVEKGAVLIELE